MSLTSLLARARAWLSATPEPPATQVVVQDRYAQSLFAGVLAEVPALTEMIDDLNRHYDFTADLVCDTFTQCYQAAPRLREASEMDESRLVNHTVASAIEASQELAQVRPFSRHQRYGSVMATLSLTERLRERLAEQSELSEASQQAQQARQEQQRTSKALDQAAGDGEQAQAELDEAMGDFDGNGPLTEDQADAQAKVDSALGRLADTLNACEAAEEAVQEAVEQAQQVAERQRTGIKGEVKAALREVAEDLQAEEDLFAAWGVDAGEVSRMSFAERQALARRLAGNRLSKFARLLGRWRTLSLTLAAKKVTSGRDEVYDTELSDRLPDVLASEFAMLGSRLGKVDFMVRMTEGRLLSKRYRGIERVGRGPLAVVLDTSDSMNKPDAAGITRECWAKGLVLALLEQARAQRRDFVVVVFASAHQQRVFRFPRGEATLDDVMALTEMAFNGGTHFETPLDMAIDLIEVELTSEGRGRGDLVLITDDEYRVPAAWLARYAERKAAVGFRTFGVAVGLPQPSSTLAALSDDVRAVTEFFDPSAMSDLIRAV